VNLDLTPEQKLLRETFDQLFATESSPNRVRESEASGSDPALWRHLADVGAFGVRVPADSGGAGGSLLDAVLLAEQAGRHLAPGPVIESITACAGLASLDHPKAHQLLDSALSGDCVLTFPAYCIDAGRTLVPGGAVATAALAFDGQTLVAAKRKTPPRREDDLGKGSFGYWDFGGPETTVLAQGDAALACFESMREEWRLLTASALMGLGRRSIEIAAAYATERIQFDRPIGSFQAIAHPLAELATAIDGGAVLIWRAVEAIAKSSPNAGSLSALAFAWAAEQAPRATHRALHTHGGYGLCDEYDIQLFHRRAKAWALAGGDPRSAYLDAADRRWRGKKPALPTAGDVQLDFSLGEMAEKFREEARRFFEAHPTPSELLVHRHDFEGYDPVFQRQMAEAGLLFTSWPEKYGGRRLGALESAAFTEELRRAGRNGYAISTTSFVGQTIIEFGSEELKQEVLPRMIRGEAICSLGFTEPSSGSDVAAAVTRATLHGDDWVIDGQKMFTSAANLAQYVFLLTRTNPDAPKHRGLTMFLVPLDSPGIEIQPIHTLSDERTNATYYTDVRVPDRYRIGPVDEGWMVLGHALHLEHGTGGGTGQLSDARDMVDAAGQWALSRQRNGRLAIDDEHVRDVLARVDAIAEVGASLALRRLWTVANDLPDNGVGSMATAFNKTTTAGIASRLMDLTAPESVLRRESDGAIDDGAFEFGYRLAAAGAIYGGTAEILNSIVAQSALGMPRSRG